MYLQLKLKSVRAVCIRNFPSAPPILLVDPLPCAGDHLFTTVGFKGFYEHLVVWLTTVCVPTELCYSARSLKPKSEMGGDPF